MQYEYDTNSRPQTVELPNQATYYTYDTDSDAQPEAVQLTPLVTNFTYDPYTLADRRDHSADPADQADTPLIVEPRQEGQD